MKILALKDVDEVFHRVATHYGTELFKAVSKQELEALRESARIIDRFSSLALTTAESLAYVYENTLISKTTRSQLGTHSTPSYLVEYILGHLADWIEEIPENERSVFEPACGHATFLVSAMRLLTQLLPTEKAVPSRRGPYLRSRLHETALSCSSPTNAMGTASRHISSPAATVIAASDHLTYHTTTSAS